MTLHGERANLAQSQVSVFDLLFLHEYLIIKKVLYDH